MHNVVPWATNNRLFAVHVLSFCPIKWLSTGIVRENACAQNNEINFSTKQQKKKTDKKTQLFQEEGEAEEKWKKLKQNPKERKTYEWNHLVLFSLNNELFGYDSKNMHSERVNNFYARLLHEYTISVNRIIGNTSCCFDTSLQADTSVSCLHKLKPVFQKKKTEF